jgi:hypothetical protein
MGGIEPTTSRAQGERATAALHPVDFCHNQELCITPCGDHIVPNVAVLLVQFHENPMNSVVKDLALGMHQRGA